MYKNMLKNLKNKFGLKFFKRVTFLTSISVSSFIIGCYFEKIVCENVASFSLFKEPFARTLLPSDNDESLGSLINGRDNSDKNRANLNPVLSDLVRFGCPSNDSIRLFDDFILSYDKRTRIANWVFEKITKDGISSNPSINRKKSEFKTDPQIHNYFKSENSDYHKSGYDRGHLAAAGNHKQSQRTLDDTFHLSNIAPQVGPGFNRDKWNQLEKHVRKLVNRYRNVYCCTGPLFLPHYEKDGKTYVKYEVIGKNYVAVPTHFFKIVFCENDHGLFDIEAYVIANAEIPDTTPLNLFQVPVDSIERAAGFLLMDKIPKNRINSINKKNS